MKTPLRTHTAAALACAAVFLLAGCDSPRGGGGDPAPAQTAGARLRFGPDGALYFSTSNRDGRGSPAADDDRIMRIVPAK